MPWPPAGGHTHAQGGSQGISHRNAATEDDHGGKGYCRRSSDLSPASQVTGEIIHVDGGSLIKATYSVLSGSNSGFCTPKIAHASLLARTT